MKKHLTKSFCNTEKVHTIDGRKVEARGSFMRGDNLGMRYNENFMWTSHEQMFPLACVPLTRD